jgi:hypothetical protein
MLTFHNQNENSKKIYHMCKTQLYKKKEDYFLIWNGSKYVAVSVRD